MHINTLRKIMSWQLLTVLAISITISGFGQVLLSATASAAVAPPLPDGNTVPTPPKGQATWFYNPEPCSQGGISADAALAYTYDDTTSERGKTIVFHCSFIMSTFNQDYMQLDGPTDCSQAFMGMRVGKDVDHQQNAPLATSKQGTLQLWPRNPRGNCTGAQSTINVKLTNTYEQGSFPPPPVSVGTAVWNKENPAELKATYTFDLGSGVKYTQKDELFDQLDGAINGNTMNLTSTNKYASQCAANQITLGSNGGNYLTDKSPDHPPTITIYLWGYEGGSDQHCYSRTGSLTLTKSYQDAGGKAATTTTDNSNGCPIDGSAGLLFLLCPVYDLGKQTVQVLNTQIENLLFINVDQIFGTATFRNSYNVFRNVGLSLLVVAGLVMVISQAAGLDIVSAYTIRKTLPRIVLAAIGIALAWPLLQFAITFINDLGSWISSVILAAAPAHGANGLPDIGKFIVDLMFTVIAGSAVIFTFGIIGGLSFLLTAAVALLIGYFFLVIRQLVIIVCVLLAPLAIAASVLPGTEKLWKFWRETTEGALLMFPIVMAFLSAGALLASIAGTAARSGGGNSGAMALIALIAYFVPYFMIPVAFRMASGVLGNVFGVVNDRGKGVFDRLTKFRGGEKEHYRNQRMQGKSGLDKLNFRNGKYNAGRFYRRFHTRGGFTAGMLLPGGWGAGSRAKYAAFDQKRISLAAQETVGKEDAGFAKNDDTANELAIQSGMNRAKFIDQYARANIGTQRTAEVARLRAGGMSQATAESRVAAMRDDEFMGSARASATNALGMLEASYGTTLGTNTMRMSAWKALKDSGTSYRGSSAGDAGDVIAGQQRMYNDAGKLIADGLMTAEQATSDIKFGAAAGARKERSGDGFGGTLNQVIRTANGAQMTRAEVVDQQRRALYNADPGDILRSRPETAKAMVPLMVENVSSRIAAVERAQTTALANPGNANAQVEYATAQRDLDDHLAQVDSLYNYLKGVSQEKADILGHGVLGAAISDNGAVVPNTNGGSGPAIGANPTGPDASKLRNVRTLRERIEAARARPFFLDKSREYGSRWAQQDAARQATQRMQNQNQQPFGPPF